MVSGSDVVIVFFVHNDDNHDSDHKAGYRKIKDNIFTFEVNKDLACFHSPVLKQAFNSESAVGKTVATYKLENVSELTCFFFKQWIHKQDFTIADFKVESAAAEAETGMC